MLLAGALTLFKGEKYVKNIIKNLFSKEKFEKSQDDTRKRKKQTEIAQKDFESSSWFDNASCLCSDR